MESSILYEAANGVAVLTLHRPQAANALSTALLMELKQKLGQLRFDRSIRCVIVTGSEKKAFCAGADLKERASMTETEVRKTVALIRETINEFEQLPAPTICAINGVAFGGGLELALACDIRIASDHAQLGLTETALGIIPGAGGTQRLPRLIGKGKAKELIFTAKRLTAAEAASIGIVEYVVPYEQLMEKANELAGQIIQNAPIAVAQAKIAINRGLEVDLYTGLKLEQMAYEMTIPTKDRLEGLQAFKEKRKPVYKGE